MAVERYHHGQGAVPANYIAGLAGLALDTPKEKQQFDDIYARGEAPWEVWLKEA